MKLVNIDTMKNINKFNYYKLKKWYEEIKDYERLTLKKAKTLNKLMLESSGEIRETYRNNLILGTIYVIYNFVCNSGFTAVFSSYFDIEDIMNSSIEIWINMLDSNILLNERVKSYSELFLKEFYVRLYKHLIGENTKYYTYQEGYSLFSDYIFSNVLSFYLEFINNGTITDEKSEYNCILHCLEECQVLTKINSSNLSQDDISRLIYKIYLIFKNIKKITDINDISRLSKTKLDYLKLILFEVSFLDRSTTLISIDDFVPEINDKIFAESLLQTNILTKREKEVLKLKYNIDSKYYPLIDPQYREIAKAIGVNKSRVKQIEDRGIERIKSKILF